MSESAARTDRGAEARGDGRQPGLAAHLRLFNIGKALRCQREVPRVPQGIEGDGGFVAGNSAEPGRTVTSKVASILTAMTTGDGHTLSTLTRQTQLPVSTVHRLLKDLVRALVVERTDHCDYQLSPGLRALRFDDVEPTVSSRGPLVVDDLTAALRTTARLGVLDGTEVAYMEKKPGPMPGTIFPNEGLGSRSTP